MLITDYLVIGAGAASLSFVDTILTECPDTTITIVDMHAEPGGHWNDAYGYVHLHQPSLLYGVASEQLEGNWLKLMLTKTVLPWTHRASKEEILAHYKSLMNKWVAQGKVKYYPRCRYDFSEKPSANDDSKLHTFYSMDDDKSYHIKVQHKLVNGILGEPKVPSQCPPTFPIDDSINVKTPNELYEEATTQALKSDKIWFAKKRANPAAGKKYVVMGCGKTAMDAVVFLQRTMGVAPDDISWVMPNDVWLIRREGPGLPASFPEALLKCDLDVDKAALSLEEQNIFARIDTNVLPTKFRFPVVGAEELTYLQKVNNKIRQGRITGITKTEGGKQKTTFQKGSPIELSSSHIFVHCASPGPFNGNKITNMFPSDREMNLSLLMAPPLPISMSCLAVLEGRRRKGLLDLECGRQLLGDKPGLTENDILSALITGYDIADDASGNLAKQVESLSLTAKFMALFDKDPKKGYSWLATNRLSTLSIPGSKCKVFETTKLILSKKDFLQLNEADLQMLTTLEEKLEPLKGL